jgi:hypothetical protein
MKREAPKNLAASVRGRLQNLARRQKADFQFVLTRYGLERLLYRLSRSPYRGEFVLKGAMLFELWSKTPHRATRDVDFLGRGDSSAARFESIFRDVCAAEVAADGLEFLSESVRSEEIRREDEYQGLRIRLEARLERAVIRFHVDIGFGDVITPAATEVEYPTLLDFPAPSLLACPKETVVAEKYQALVMLGLANSRMKDFFDLWAISRDCQFDGAILCRAIRATFERRETALPPETPVALSPAFADDRLKTKQWYAFLQRSRLAEARLGDVLAVLRAFLLPPTSALRDGSPFTVFWPAGGPWGANSTVAPETSQRR